MPIVPWIKAADPAKEFLQAYQTSAQISQANARMAQSAAQADREYALQQQAMEQRQERQQRQDDQDAQQLEVTKSYREQQMQLGQQKLAQAKEYNDQRIKQAAQKFTTQQQAQQEIGAIDAAVANGDIDEEEGRKQKISAIVRNSAGTASAVGPMLQTLRPPATFGKSAAGQEYVTEPTGEARWGAAPARAPTDTVTETIPAVEGSPAVPAQPASKGFLGFFAHPDIPSQPAILGHGDLKRTRHVPIQIDTASGSLMDAYRAKTATGTAPTATGTAPPQITTQEQYDALAPGSIYIGKGGKRYRKPGDAKPPSIFKDEPVPESSHDDEGD
jgi:hypothetical protein